MIHLKEFGTCLVYMAKANAIQQNNNKLKGEHPIDTYKKKHYSDILDYMSS